MEKPVLVIVTLISLFINFSTAQLNSYCLTPNSERATCILLTDCTYLYNIFISPDLKNQDKSYLRQSFCGHDDYKQVLICCPARYRQPQPQPPPNNNNNRPISRPSISSNIGFPGPSSGGNTNSRTNTNNLLPSPPVCGNVISHRILGGKATKIDEYPWMALIEYTKPGNNIGHHCGGSLINSRYVITAAHCVNGKGLPPSWRITGVRLGEWDTTTNIDCEFDSRGQEDCAPEFMDVSVERVISHPSYNPSSKNQLNDIALLRLRRSVNYNDFIRPICLPTLAKLRSSMFQNFLMDVAGWGRTENGSESTIKLKAGVTGQSLEDCKRKYGPRNINLDNSQLCAGGVRGIDSCRGDSGGPLIGLETNTPPQNFFFLAGIVSFGPTPCGLEGWPGVYTRVGHFIDWIEQNISP